jgi:signal transduction histidine kinase
MVNSETLEISELQSRYARLQLLYDVSNTIHSTLDAQEALGLIISEAVRVLRGSSGSVALVNPTTSFLEIQAAYQLPPNSSLLRLKVGEGITGWVALTGKAARVGDVSKDSRYIMVKQNIRSELAVPLEVNGEVRGVLNVDSERLDAFSEADEQLLRDLAIQAARVIQNTWLYEQIRQKARLFESLISVSQAINSTLNLNEALRVIAREACSLMNARMCSLLMLDETGEWLELQASHGAGEAYINKPRLGLSESLLGIVVRRKKPLQVENVQTSSRYQHIEIARKENLVSLLSVPLVFQQKAIGTLSVYTSQQHSFSNEEIRILSALAELSGIAIEKARLYERLVDIEDQLRQNERLSAIGLLAAEVAHEIRNPLTVMQMLFHSLNLQFDADDPRARDAQVMRERMTHLNRIVEQILDFARTADPEFARVNINKLLEELALLTRHKLTNQKVSLEHDLEPGLPEIEADASQLNQVFLNLTLNAVEAMPSGGRLTIKTMLAQGDKPEVRIEFTDTGCGMTSEQQRDAFASLLQTSKKKGTGLGLAIVGKIVEAHHGKITVRSKLNKGSTFKVSLPVRR